MVGFDASFAVERESGIVVWSVQFSRFLEEKRRTIGSEPDRPLNDTKKDPAESR